MTDAPDDPAPGLAPPAPRAESPAGDVAAIVYAWFDQHLVGKAIMFAPASGDIVAALPALIAALEAQQKG